MSEADNDFVSPFENDDAWFGPPDRPDRLRFGFDPSRYGPAPEKIALWRREYTHPWKLTPGFTYDFAPSEDPTITSGNTSPPIYLDEDGAGPSSSASTSSSATAVETTLVCARCLEPLVLAPSNDTSYQSEEMKMRRVWALRCGHMLDGKCVADLMVPPEAPAESVSMEPTEEQLIANAKGKGKAREGADIDMPHAVAGEGDVPLAEETAIPDRKGKRKAVEPPESQAPPKRPALASAAKPEPNSIRSRLRSHGRAGADESPSSSGAPAYVTAAAAENDSFSSSTRRGRRQPGTSPVSTAQTQSQTRSRAKGKGKGKAKVEQKPLIEAEHEWKCPVAGCGCVHYSVRVNGVWKTDETRGPIALFV
ncbi:hypothetical protein BN946_scf184945.g6 [Trametes cinnabarina]|uniref:Uncharacterized protein n=1 Tax=Pycnoporus cinnabarinus TaxID=5643 RepID=A0A060SRU4_PYCCI|nr:hypothetical protein BN946_scf184945.g6 [Trametes cinnabarina]